MSSDKLSLYEIGAEGQFLQDVLIDNEGVLTEEIEERLTALMVSGPKTIQAAGHVLANLEFAQAAREMESKRLHDQAKAIEAGIDRLKARMVAALDMAFNGKLQTETHTYTTQKTADTYVVELADGVALTELQKERPDFIRQKLELDKQAIKAAFDKEQPLPDSIFVTRNPGKRYLKVR